MNEFEEFFDKADDGIVCASRSDLIVYINRDVPGAAVYCRVGNGRVKATAFNTADLSVTDRLAAEQVARWLAGEPKLSVAFILA